jgi:hypothetical protein
MVVYYRSWLNEQTLAECGTQGKQIGNGMSAFRLGSQRRASGPGTEAADKSHDGTDIQDFRSLLDGQQPGK